MKSLKYLSELDLEQLQTFEDLAYQNLVKRPRSKFVKKTPNPSNKSSAYLRIRPSPSMMY